MNENRKKVIRCDALFHLIKIKNFTKKHLFRLVFIDENGVEVVTNALGLEISSVRIKDKAAREIVYIRHNFTSGIHILYRSGCTLEKHQGGEWVIKNEIILSWVELVI